ncbi:DUF167 domain-containing protein [Croceicoccus ponticola]|uniref:UPF0235 protein EKN06_07310 n=1 Tax=Croceicoccus ponticola TaxID=2217664 RepID=A0A437GZ00_9SPHN|nr:DUF167 domain-containing protein [Croceicoccus ponticola]RVQ67730.1 DUF167 domain-containing protein [Croceicoccus ponticola]
MGKPKANLPSADSLRALIDERGLLALRVTPNAATDALAIENGQLRARVTAVPEDGRANKAVIALLGKAMGIAPARIELVRGATARDKVLRIEG